MKYAYYVGWDNGLYYMYPSSDYKGIYIDREFKPEDCQGVKGYLIPYDPRCRPWYK